MFLIRVFLLLALAGAGVFGEPGRTRVTVLHLNDVYEYNAVDDGRKGSFSRIETLRKQQVKRNPNTLFVFAGDTLSPSVASSFFRGRQMIELWNSVSLDVAVLGNHEFDFGDDVLKARLAESRFTWLGSNVVERQSQQIFGGMPPHRIFDFQGTRVGVFGLLTPSTVEASNASEQVVFLDPIEVAREQVRALRREGAEVIIALTHLTMAEDKELARQVEVDLVLGGHDHEPLHALVGGVPIFKWGSDARIMGVIDLDIEDGRVVGMDWQSLSVGRSIAKDPAVESRIQQLNAELNLELDQPVARLASKLEGRNFKCRSQETQLGNLVSDAFRARFSSDIALTLGSSMRLDEELEPGVLSLRQAMQILPYENALVEVEISGRQLLQVLEHAVSSPEVVSERFLQISGFRFSYDSRRPAGSRVVEVRIGDQPLDPEARYRLACNEFLRKGGCGFRMLSRLPILREAEDAPNESHVVLEYLKAQATLAPQLENRITNLAGAGSR